MRSWRCSVASDAAVGDSGVCDARVGDARPGSTRVADTAPARPATLVDSCVLLDLITCDEQWADWSAEQVARAMDAGRVVINPLIYAEVSVGYESIEELDELLSPSDFD